MKLFFHTHTKNLLFIALLGTVMQEQTAQAKDSNTLHNIAVGTTIAAVAYGINWIYDYALYSRASSRYELPIAVVAAYASNPNDHTSLYEELLGLVNIDNAQWSSPRSKYHDYPLVEFVGDLDWYLTRLTIGSWLTMPTQLSTDMQTLKEQLQRVRFYCVRHPRYIEERRHANQLAAHNAQHVIVH